MHRAHALCVKHACGDSLRQKGGIVNETPTPRSPAPHPGKVAPLRRWAYMCCEARDRRTRATSMSNLMQFTGIHHLTAITANAKGNVAFYTRQLGMRLVKK